MKSDLSPDEPNEVSCRRAWGDLAGAAMFAYMGLSVLVLALLPSKATPPAPNLGGAAFSLPFLAAAAACTLLRFRGYLIADETGLRWRGLGSERAVRWNQVTDYYLRSSSRNSGAIETSLGKIDLSCWANTEPLAATVAVHALNAKSGEWGVRGIRPEDEWPIIFKYDYESRTLRVTEKVALVFMSVYPPASMLAILTQVSPAKIAATLEMMWQFNGPAATITIVAILWVPGGFFFLVAPFFWLYMLTHLWGETRNRSADQLIATPVDLTLLRDGKSHTIRWADVTDYVIARPHHTKMPALYRVETPDASIDWTGSLINKLKLGQIVQRYVSGAAAKEWVTLDSRIAKQQTQQGFSKTGTRRFTYRTENIRISLWVLSTLCLLPAILRIVLTPGSMEPVRPPLLSVPFCSALAMVPVWALWSYYTSSITVTPEGIVQRSPLRKRFIAWDAVTAFKTSPRAFFNYVYGSNTVVTFIRELTEIDDLRSIIIQHATPATQHKGQDKQNE